MPMPGPPQGGPSPFPPQAGPPPGGLPPDVPPALAQVALQVAHALQVPPLAVLHTMLGLMQHGGPVAVLKFVEGAIGDPAHGVPPDPQHQEMARQLVLEASAPPPGQGPPQMPHMMPPPGPPGLAPPPGGGMPPPPPGLGGPPGAMPGGPPPPLGPGGPVPLPPPGVTEPYRPLSKHLGHDRPPSVLRAKPKPKPTPPEPWEPQALKDLCGPQGAEPSIYWKKPPERERVIRDAQRHRMQWAARDHMIMRQVNKYARVDDRLDLNGNPIDPASGGMYFKLSRATTTIDRLIGDALPTTATIVIDVPSRAADEETRDSAQACENWLRTLDEEDQLWWDGLASRGVIATHLPRKRIGLMALMGAQAACFRLNPGARDHFIIEEPLALSEVYPGALSTTRQSYLRFDEACALYPEILTKLADAGYDEADPARRFGVADTTIIRVIGWSDKDGLWRCVTWDWGQSGGIDRTLLDLAKDGDNWIVKPVRIDYGFCYYQIGTYWNGPPQSAMQGTQDYSEQAARGAIYSHVDMYEEMDKIASALKTNFMQNLHPSWVRKSSEPEEQAGKPVLTGINEVNDIELEGGIEALYVNATGTPDGAATMAIFAGEMADISNPVSAGRGGATSGSDRAQIAEQAGNLHLDQLKEGYCADRERFGRLKLELLYRKGAGGKKAWKTMAYRQFKGGDAGSEGTLTIEDLRRAGSRVVVRYHQEDLAAEQQKNQVWLERLKADVTPLRTVREKLGSENPDADADMVIEDKTINANPKLQDALSQEALRELDYNLYLAYMQSQAEGPGGGGGAGQMGSQPGMPHMAGAAGVPMPGMAPPPGLPPGLG
jgi:hypothetical protein